MHENGDHRGRYTLTDENGHVWGACPTVEGFFGNHQRGTYELFGWIPECAEIPDRPGNGVWLVPDDKALDPWRLDDVENLGRCRGADSLVMRGLDEFEGPPEGYRGPVRVHNGHRWLGSCREFTRILPAEEVPALVLRRLVPSDRLLTALATGTRRALNLGEATLEVRADHGALLLKEVLWPKISAWAPSFPGSGLIDLHLAEGTFTPVHERARPLWDQWFTGPPASKGAWTGLDTGPRGDWLTLVRQRGCQITHRARPAGHTYELDGRHVTDEPGLYLALGEAVNGPGGYFGGCLPALADCLYGGFGYTAPSTLLWRDAATAREHLSRTLSPEGEEYSLFSVVLDVLAERGMSVTLA
ncbi:hypothetical protein [Actinomadura sp. NPDC000600]|uniref:barstar family protein n=1 Tax=Actinomadura sp. NPDC000600 TaxID=3154262 RepID=UPI00339A0E34